MNVTGTQPRERELSCSGKFAGKSGDGRPVGVIVGGRTAGPGLICEPGPASLGEASTPFASSFPCTLELSCDLGVVAASSGKENNPCTGHVSLRAGRFASDRFKIGSILSGQRDSDWAGTWRHVLSSLETGASTTGYEKTAPSLSGYELPGWSTSSVPLHLNLGITFWYRHWWFLGSVVGTPRLRDGVLTPSAAVDV